MDKTQGQPTASPGQPLLDVTYFEAPGDSLLLSKLRLIPDAAILPEEHFVPGTDDTTEISRKIKIMLIKRRMTLGRLQAIRDAINSKAFRLLESYLWNVIKDIDQKDIWEALESGDNKKVAHLYAMRLGIKEFCTLYNDVTDQVSTEEQLIAALEQGNPVMGLQDLEE